MKVSGSLSGVDQPTMLLVICIVVAVLSTASNIDCVVSNDFRWNCFDIGVMGLISSLTLGFFCLILVIYNNLTFEFTEEALVTKHYFIEFRTDFTYDSIDKIEFYPSFLGSNQYINLYIYFKNNKKKKFHIVNFGNREISIITKQLANRGITSYIHKER